MRTRTSFCTILLVLWGSAAAFSQSIRGKVTDTQGNGIARAAVTALEEQAKSSSQEVQTASDGSYSFDRLAAGRYMIRARRAGFAEQRQGPIEISGAGGSTVVNFRLGPATGTEAIRGAEERNPNDFVIRLDTNSITNEMIRNGTNLRFLNEFRADRSSYGEPFGYPLRRVEWTSAHNVLNRYHGSISEFHQDSALNARPFFQVGSLLPSRRNQYGFSVSGPIVPERWSFNFAWGQVHDSGFVNGNVQVPLADERTPRSEDSGMNEIIGALLTAYSKELPNLPHVSKRHLNTNAFRNIRSTAFSVHLDGSLRSGDRLAFDQQFSDRSEDPFELVLGQNPQTTSRPQSLRFTYIHNLSPHAVMQVSANYTRLRVVLLPTKGYQDLLKPLGISNVPDIQLGDELSKIGIPGQGIPRKRFENHYQLSPQFNNTSGRHSLTFGMSVKHLWDSDERTSNGRGTLAFTRDFTIFDPELVNPDGTRGGMRTATAVENFLRGQASRLSLTVGNQYRGYRNWEWIAYFQDRFAVRPDLQLSWGLRYEVLTSPKEVNHLFEFQHHTDANNFAPQFGFAWHTPKGGMVVRGGYGIAFGSLTIATWNRQAGNPPLTYSLSVDKPDVSVIREIPTLQPDPSRKAGRGLLDRDAVLPYSHIYNLSVERELPGAVLVRAGYQGIRTFKMFAGLSLNRAVDVPGVVATSGNVNARRPDQTLLRVYNIVNGSNGYHDGLQISASKRRTKGLAFEVRYSFSKTIDTGIYDFADTGNGGDVSQTEELVSDVKSVAAFDTPQSFSMSYSYELPGLEATPQWFAGLLRRWTISGTTTFRSGTPFALFTGSDGPGSGNVDGEDSDRPNLLNAAILGQSFDNPDTSQVLLGAIQVGSDGKPLLDASGNTIPACESVPEGYLACPYFDTNLLVGGRGNIGYRVFRKDGTNNWNLALGRNFTLPGSGNERQLQFRAEFYNFLNHAQFAAPGNSISSPTFGQITNTVNKGRVTQFSLRLLF